MNQNKQSRAAIPGDTFILLAPSAQELHLLQQKHNEFQSQYGGKVVDHIHITCERFTPKRADFPKECIAVLRHHIGNLEPFAVFADAVIQFHAPYWRSHVLRWRIQESVSWEYFRTTLAKTLKGIACPSHFDRYRRSTCSILSLEHSVPLMEKQHKLNYPHKLFTAQKVQISQLKEDYQFEIIETVQLSGQVSS